MPTQPLHPQAKKSLFKRLQFLLSNCIVNEGLVSFSGHLLPENQAIIEIEKHKKEWISPMEAIGVLVNNIQNYIKKSGQEPTKLKNQYLKNIISDNGIKELTNIIISYIESIPKDYYVYFKLPSIQAIGRNEINLTKDITLVESQKTKGGILGTRTEHEVYVRIKADGYADNSLESSALRKAYSKFKQLIFLSDTIGILQMGGTAELMKPELLSEILAPSFYRL